MSAQTLPNSGCALVEVRKALDYLLNADHPDGCSKAKFFMARGFSAGNAAAMQAALRTQGQDNWVTKVTCHPWGARYQVDCHCPTPDGMNPCIRTVWEIETPEVCPRLITAHPL